MRKPWHRRAAFLALIALLLQLAVPLWHTPPAVAAMLCPEHMMMGMDGQGMPDTPQPGLPKPGKSCPICQVAHAGGAGLLPTPTAVAVPVEFSYFRFLPPSDDRVVEPAAPTPSTRGPPAV
jgi:hypothetical protein